MDPLIIGLCGYAGAGKDTVARYIQAYCDAIGSAECFAFADPMRDMLEALGVTRQQMEDRQLKEQVIPGLGYSYRQLAQTLGTEWGRTCHGENFWVNALALRISKSLADVRLITDVRFPNEEAWVRELGGYLLRVERPGVERIQPHASEAFVDSMTPDVTVVNSDTLDRLKRDAIDAFKEVLVRRIQRRNHRSNAV